MITPPTGWDALWADPDSRMELRFTIDSDVYLDADIADSDCRLAHSMYDSYGIGNACAAKLTITLLDAQPILGGVRECTLECRLSSQDGQTVTDWVPQGTYYLDSAEWASDGSYVSLTMYDALALSGIYLYADGVAPSSDTWPKAASAVIAQACSRCGMDAPADMSAFSGISCPNVDYITCREALGSLAAIAGGNWTVGKSGRLKFVPLADDDASLQPVAAVSVAELKRTSTVKQVGRVRLLADNENFEQGSGDFVVEGQCFYASDAAATAARNAVLGKKYQGWSATGAFASPLLELGDYVAIEGDTVEMFADSLSLAYSQGCWGEVSAPLRDEVERRIEGKTASDRKVNRLAAVMGDTTTSEEFIAGVLDRLNGYINSGGGWTYIVPGHGMLTYDREVADPLVGTEARCVVEIKGGSVRIANSKKTPFSGIDDWNWMTVLNAGQVSSQLITAVNIVAGFIGSPSGNYWNLDNGFIHTVSGEIGGFSIGQHMLYNGLDTLTGTSEGVYLGTNGVAVSTEYDTDNNGTTEQHSIALSGGGIQGYFNGSPAGYITPNATADYTDANDNPATYHGPQIRGDVIDIRANVLTVKPVNSTSGDSTKVLDDFGRNLVQFNNVSYDANTSFKFSPCRVWEHVTLGMKDASVFYYWNNISANTVIELPTKKYTDGEINEAKLDIISLESAMDAVRSRISTLESKMTTAESNITSLQSGKVDKTAFAKSGSTLFINI